jgi:hypothetical protein
MIHLPFYSLAAQFSVAGSVMPAVFSLEGRGREHAAALGGRAPTHPIRGVAGRRIEMFGGLAFPSDAVVPHLSRYPGRIRTQRYVGRNQTSAFHVHLLDLHRLIAPA